MTAKQKEIEIVRQIDIHMDIVVLVYVYTYLDRSIHLFISDESNFDIEIKILLMDLYMFFLVPVD